ncbi:hypothetical protein Ddye_024445 [Dipteronia dyeriana]|uniref:Secreted protein n=1 Tax=Dipteronia dyeriana TaxID=168575 RepID=A0AAD9TUX9_9ROSI|nr:hypothetical protein Ddye_024445 [Dipteronia dyeriana]
MLKLYHLMAFLLPLKGVCITASMKVVLCTLASIIATTSGLFVCSSAGFGTIISSKRYCCLAIVAMSLVTRHSMELESLQSLQVLNSYFSPIFEYITHFYGELPAKPCMETMLPLDIGKVCSSFYLIM